MLGGVDPLRATLVRVLFAVALFSILFTMIGWWPKVRDGFRDRRAIALTAGGAFFGPFLGVTLSLVALSHARAGVVATILALLPVTMIPAVFVLHGERVSVRGALGAALATAGVAIMFLA